MGSHFQGTATPLFGKGNGTVFSALPNRNTRILFIKEFDGERMHRSERGKGKRWATWKKGTYKTKPKSPYDFSED
jgi:hypothetical protein